MVLRIIIRGEVTINARTSMKKIYAILVILAVAAGFTGCSKDNIVQNNELGAGISEAVVFATTDAVTKTTLSDEYKVLWAAGDCIKFVNSSDKKKTFTFSLKTGEGTTEGVFTGKKIPADGEYTVYYPASYNGSEWPEQSYISSTDISGAPMVATATVSNGVISNLSFTNEGGILRYTLKGSKVIQYINVKSDSPALDVFLDCGDGVALTAEGVMFNITVPSGTYSDATLTLSATDTTIATMTASSLTVTKNKVSLATFEDTAFSFEKAPAPAHPDGALFGKFTINSDGDQVYFSQGNLYAKKNGDSWSWLFYEKQTQYNSIPAVFKPGSPGLGRTASATDAEIDLFTWGYNATNSIDPVGSDYITGHTTDGETFSKGEDWGYVFGGSSSVWRTLTKAEWEYLLEHHSHLKIEVEEVKGLVIAPDDFSGDIYDYFYSYTDNATLAADNLVFLPLAGYRSGSYVGYVGDYGYYWSSSAIDESSAYSVLLGGAYPYTINNNGRNRAISVRLVTRAL